MIDKFNQIMYAENKIDRLFNRYEHYASRQKELQHKIKDIQRRNKQQEEIQTFNKNHLVDDIRKENQELVKMLVQQSQYKQRERLRYMEYCKNKYGKSWETHKIPYHITSDRSTHAREASHLSHTGNRL